MLSRKIFILIGFIFSLWLSCSNQKEELGITPAKFSRAAFVHIQDLQSEIMKFNSKLDTLDLKIDNFARKIRDIDKNIFSNRNLLNGNDLKADSANNSLKDSQIQKNMERIEEIETWLSKYKDDYRKKDAIKLKDRLRTIQTYINRLNKSRKMKELLIELHIEFRGEIDNSLEKKEELKEALTSLKTKYETELREVKNDQDREIKEKQDEITELTSINNDLENEKVNLNEKIQNYRKEIQNDELKKKYFQSNADSIQLIYDAIQIKINSYEIEQIFRYAKEKGMNSDSLNRKMEYLISLHDILVVNLTKTDRKTVEFTLAEIKKQFAQIRTLLEEYEDLKNRVISLFEGGIFSQYFQLSKEDIFAKDEKVLIYIKVFKTMVPLIIKFLETFDGYKIYIDGHADRTPWSRDKYGNMKLSKDRADFTKSQFVEAGVLPNRIVVDWFGEFHNTKKIPVSSKNKEQVADRRVDLRIIGGESDSTVQKMKYKEFKEKFAVFTGSENKFFSHDSGFWTEYGFENADYPIRRVVYKDSTYRSLFKESKIAEQVLARHPSPLYPNGEIELGNQVKLILPIKGKKYKIIIESDQLEDKKQTILK